MTLIETLKELQGTRSQERFAAEIGISQSMLSLICNGERRVSLRLAHRLAQLYPELASEIGSLVLSQDITTGNSEDDCAA